VTEIRFFKTTTVLNIILASALVGSLANAAGYEKSIMWGGKSAGLTGIATPYTSGGEAVYFNPAGLAGDKVGSDASFYISPSWNSERGPFDNNNTIIASENGMITPPALFYGRTVNDKWGYGVGFYSAGGLVVNYNDVAYSGAAGPVSLSHINADLKLFEFSPGVGYKVNDKLKVGAAWRMEIAEASFAFAQRLPGTGGAFLLNAEVNDVKAQSYEGLKFGAQYKFNEKHSFSFVYRSPTVIQGKGKFGGTLRRPTIAGGDVAIDKSSVKVGTEFPQQVTLGAMHKLSDTWNLFEEYTWTDYSKVDHITLDGTITVPAVFSAEATDMKQQWHDQQNIKVAAEYLGFAMPIRFGVQWVNAVTAKDMARLTSTPPGDGFGVSLGTEYKPKENLTLSVAGEYAKLEGDATGAAPGDATSDFRAGKVTGFSSAIHLGAQYEF
jgi:long-subunit fatty acid transport protein